MNVAAVLSKDHLWPRLDCSSVLAGLSCAGSDVSNLADLQSGHGISVFHSRIYNWTLVNSWDFSCAESAIVTFSVLTACDHWNRATDKGVLRPCRRIVDTTGLSTNENEDPAAHIASTLKFRSSFTSLMRTTGKPSLCDVFFSTALVAYEVPVVASLFEKSLCRSSLRRRPQLGTLQVLLL